MVVCKKDLKNQNGFSMLEVLVSVAILSIVGLGISQSSIGMLRARTVTLNKQVSTQLATEKLEQYAALDPLTLSAENSNSESLSHAGKSFLRSSTITVNSNGSRTVTVSVRPADASQSGSANLSGTFTSWSMS